MPAISEENDVVERVLDGERISQDDARALYGLPLQELGALADYRRQAAKADAYGGRGGEIVTYIVDRNVNYTNVCNVYCKFCAFYRTERDDDHYVLSLEQIDEKLDELAAQGGVQVLLQGGHHPKLGIDYYLDDAIAYSREISADQHSRIQSAGVQPFCQRFRHAVAHGDREV